MQYLMKEKKERGRVRELYKIVSSGKTLSSRAQPQRFCFWVSKSSLYYCTFKKASQIILTGLGNILQVYTYTHAHK